MATDDRTYAGELYREHRDRLFRVAVTVGASRDTAEDIVHEVFRDVVRFPERYRRSVNVEGYLVSVAVNTTRKTLASQKRRKALSIDAVPEPSVTPSDAPTHYFGSLDETDARVVILADLMEYTYAEVGALMGNTARQVETLLTAARAKLRDALEAIDAKEATRARRR